MIDFSKINNLRVPRFRYKNYEIRPMLTYYSSLDYHYNLFHFSIQYRKTVDLDYSYLRYISVRVFNFSFTLFFAKYENMHMNRYEAYKIAYKKYIIK